MDREHGSKLREAMPAGTGEAAGLLIRIRGPLNTQRKSNKDCKGSHLVFERSSLSSSSSMSSSSKVDVCSEMCLQPDSTGKEIDLHFSIA